MRVFPIRMFGLRQLHDVGGSLFEGEKLPAFWQRDRILERARPGHTAIWAA
jgi:hypothetical protein